MRGFLHLLLTIGAVLVALVALPGTCWAATPAGAKALESRLYAPCCYGGTLDIHESDLARTLRDEIESRLARGESQDTVQADFVARYGEKVLAARSDSPSQFMGIGVGIAGLVAAAGLVAVVRRWTRRPDREEGATSTVACVADDALDGRIDADLAALDA